MVANGIKAIWSFSPNKLHVPKDVIVLHENLAASLAVLSKQLLTAQLQAKP
jgi:NADH/NAD ratio-sensing transcriptional regulator Rex